MRICSLLLLGSAVAFVGCNPPSDADSMTPATPATPATSSSGTTAAALPAVDKNVKLVSMKVSMHCAHGCYPRVKETLEEQGGVANVTLAEQKTKDAIDNPVVYIATSGDFDAQQAIKALEKEGFESEVLN